MVLNSKLHRFSKTFSIRSIPFSNTNIFTILKVEIWHKFSFKLSSLLNDKNGALQVLSKDLVYEKKTFGYRIIQHGYTLMSCLGLTLVYRTIHILKEIFFTKIYKCLKKIISVLNEVLDIF